MVNSSGVALLGSSDPFVNTSLKVLVRGSRAGPLSAFHRLFHRVEPGEWAAGKNQARTRRSVEQRGERPCRLGLHAREHVLVRRHGEGGGGVSQPLAYDLD